MRVQVQIALACPNHERPDAGCAGCNLAQTFAQEWETIRQRRAAFLERVKMAVRTKTIVISEIR